MKTVNEGKWQEIQQRSIALTGRLLEDLSTEEASTVAQSLTEEEKALIVERAKPRPPRRYRACISQNELIRYRQTLKSARLHQGKLRELRERILGKFRAGAKVQQGIFVAGVVRITRRGKTIEQLRVGC